MNDIRCSDGYSLVESLVAVSLLVGVLIPLLIATGDRLVLEGASDLAEALALAQREISAPLELSGQILEQRYERDGLTVERIVAWHKGFGTLTVTVCKGPKVLVILHRVYEHPT